MVDSEYRRAAVIITYKPEVNDPEKREAAQKIDRFGEAQVLAKGKYFELDVRARSDEEALARTQEMADQLLANPIIEKSKVFQLTDGEEHLLVEPIPNSKDQDIEVVVTLKLGVNNPAARVVTDALHQLNFDANVAVMGSYYRLGITGSKDQALKEATRLSSRALINPVLETFKLYPPVK